jgi:hypothetical protein
VFFHEERESHKVKEEENKAMRDDTIQYNYSDFPAALLNYQDTLWSPALMMSEIIFVQFLSPPF